MDARRYAIDAILRDEKPVHIRAIRPDDKTRLLRAFRRLSGRSVYLRFLQERRELTEQELSYLTEIDFVRHVALVATISEEGEERIVGVGRFILLDQPPRRRRAEVALAVVDEHQGRGIGSLLFHHLASIARRQGIVELEAEVLAENRHVFEVAERAGLKMRRSVDSGVVHISLTVGGLEKPGGTLGPGGTG